MNNFFTTKRKLEVDFQICEDLKYEKYTIQIWIINRKISDILHLRPKYWHKISKGHVQM